MLLTTCGKKLERYVLNPPGGAQIQANRYGSANRQHKQFRLKFNWIKRGCKCWIRGDFVKIIWKRQLELFKEYREPYWN